MPRNYQDSSRYKLHQDFTFLDWNYKSPHQKKRNDRFFLIYFVVFFFVGIFRQKKQMWLSMLSIQELSRLELPEITEALLQACKILFLFFSLFFFLSFIWIWYVYSSLHVITQAKITESHSHFWLFQCEYISSDSLYFVASKLLKSTSQVCPCILCFWSKLLKILDYVVKSVKSNQEVKLLCCGAGCSHHMLCCVEPSGEGQKREVLRWLQREPLLSTREWWEQCSEAVEADASSSAQAVSASGGQEQWRFTRRKELNLK